MVETKCEVYSRVVGYIRPVEQWHEGKISEFKDRVLFNTKGKPIIIGAGQTTLAFNKVQTRSG